MTSITFGVAHDGLPWTPTRHRAERRAWRTGMQDLRAEMRAIRALRATGKVLDAEEAQGRLDVAWQVHRRLQERLRMIRSVKVEAYSHLSPTAAKREAARRRQGA